MVKWKMDLKERQDEMAQDRDQWRALVKTVMNLLVPQNAGKFLSSRTPDGFSRRFQLHEVISFVPYSFFPFLLFPFYRYFSALFLHPPYVNKVSK
jgi:hypothetical protein